ncbi:hypothetical protein [Candidatus Mycobacterium methanotrophicum]|uniref:Uncharacterized protein n=1 Tax=Candidatus Mycobacterium methanotrophicum TaxID=2943498 RepID=A0ABY4QRI0_9MYCO|nr:hypothetical protein [Candidatus Mycobacterium methanotrophicum]UQX12348.1 hypothetical protein M5I08_08880 [Candidatus Mycobacterium methanotrophicum]
MPDRDRFSDETPIADAVEQEQETTFEPIPSHQETPPIEANASDWNEQRQEIGGGDDEEYRD